MAGIGIFYGSSTGNTKDVSVKLQAALGGDLYNITDVDADTISGYRHLIFASSNLDDVDFSGKKVGIMGLGDQENYGDTFVDGMVVLAEKIEERGGSVVGFTSTAGYNYDNSEAEKDGQFIGLVIDEDGQSGKTNERIKAWVIDLKKVFI